MVDRCSVTVRTQRRQNGLLGVTVRAGGPGIIDDRRGRRNSSQKQLRDDSYYLFDRRAPGGCSGSGFAREFLLPHFRSAEFVLPQWQLSGAVCADRHPFSLRPLEEPVGLAPAIALPRQLKPPCRRIIVRGSSRGRFPLSNWLGPWRKIPPRRVHRATDWRMPEPVEAERERASGRAPR